MLDDFLRNTLKFAPRQLTGFHSIGKHLKTIFTSFSPKKIITAIFLLLEIFSLIIFDTPVTPSGQELDLTGYELVFEDDFNGNTLNLEAWEYRGLGARRGGFNSANQVRVENGNLIMTGEYRENGEYGSGWYTGMIKLRQRYTRGYFEIRCICNAGSGFWSAFWIQADAPYTAAISQGGIGGCEIDIFEAMGYDDVINSYVTSTVHCAGVGGVQEGFQSYMLGKFKANNIYEEYNTYGLEWTEDEYIFYVNGVESGRTSFGDGVSRVPEDVIVSLEIPDETKLAELDQGTYQTQFIVDYVKIYQK